MVASVRIDTRQMQRDIARLSDEMKKQVPFAAALALTRTAQAGKKNLTKEVESKFDSPSMYITRGTFNTSATKADLSAWIGMRDKAARGASPAQYVQESFAGGPRGTKPYELAMQGMGVLPSGMRAVPAVGMKLDRSGGPNRSQLAEVMGAIKRGIRVFAGRGKRASVQAYFVVKEPRNARTRHLTPGIYRRINRGGDSVVQPVFLFIKDASYRKVIDLPDVARKTVNETFRREFAAALERAMRTAR